MKIDCVEVSRRLTALFAARSIILLLLLTPTNNIHYTISLTNQFLLLLPLPGRRRLLFWGEGVIPRPKDGVTLLLRLHLSHT